MSHITYDGDHVTVKCRNTCQTVLAVDNIPTDAYCELVITLLEPNGLLSKHETPVCKACRGRILAANFRPGELEAIFAEDIEEWIIQAKRHGFSDEIIAKSAVREALRRPLRALDELSRRDAELEAA
jgi:hypothetical protein